MQITLTINHQADTTEALADFGRKLMQMFGSLALTPALAPVVVVEKTAAPAPAPAEVVAPVVVFPVANGGGASGVSAPLASVAVAVAAPVEPKRGRGRPPLAQPAIIPAVVVAPAPVVETPAPVAPNASNFFDLDAPPAEPAVTEGDARLAFIDLARTPGGEAAVAEVMANFKVTKWASLAPESYGAIQRALKTAKIQLDAKNRAGAK